MCVLNLKEVRHSPFLGQLINNLIWFFFPCSLCPFFFFNIKVSLLIIWALPLRGLCATLGSWVVQLPILTRCLLLAVIMVFLNLSCLHFFLKYIIVPNRKCHVSSPPPPTHPSPETWDGEREGSQSVSYLCVSLHPVPGVLQLCLSFIVSDWSHSSSRHWPAGWQPHSASWRSKGGKSSLL